MGLLGGHTLNTSLDVVILTLNEQGNIEECIASAINADRVIVIDSGSGDRTSELARAAGAEVIIEPFVDFATQRNFALSICTAEWVLHLDADERLTPSLWEEIGSVLAADLLDGYRVPCLNFFAGAPLRHGGWYPQYHVRLQRRTKARWVGDVHEVALIDGQIGTLTEPIVHMGHPDITTFLEKVNRYTTIDADLVRIPAPLLPLVAVLEPVPYFLYKYLVQLGFLDGWRGLAAATLLAMYRSVTYLKAAERSARNTRAR